jgi:hypothetical protein
MRHGTAGNRLQPLGPRSDWRGLGAETAVLVEGAGPCRDALSRGGWHERHQQRSPRSSRGRFIGFRLGGVLPDFVGR